LKREFCYLKREFCYLKREFCYLPRWYVAENKEVPDSNIGVPPVRKCANYRTLTMQNLQIQTL
jgi:hypothetical protein